MPATPKRRPRDAPTPKRLQRRPAKPGDVWGIRVREDSYVMVYVWSLEQERARVEYLDWIGPSLPAGEQLEPLGIRGRADGRWQMLATKLDKATGSILVAEARPHPKTTEPKPDRVPVGAARELAELADWCFPELDAG